MATRRPPAAAVSHIHISPSSMLKTRIHYRHSALIEQNIVAKGHAGEVIMNGALLTAFSSPAR